MLPCTPVLMASSPEIAAAANVASPTGGGPEIPYFQVEIGKRLPLPFARAADDIGALRLSAKGISALVVEPITVDAAFGGANKFLARTASPTALAALRGERQAPPRLGTLAEGLESPTKTVAPKRMPKVPGKGSMSGIQPLRR